MRVAIVGTGISGLVAARLLCTRHDVTVFEAADRLGGHTHTREIVHDGHPWSVDSGFIVYNERTYPNFVRLMEILEVETQESEMSFSVRDEVSRLEWCGTNLDTLFAQRRNLLSPGFWRMIRDILRFNRESRGLLDGDDEQLTLGAYLSAGGYSRRFIEHYIVPMGAAIWSASPEAMLEFPALTFVRFFDNHGMLSIDERPVWRVVSGGSAQYLERLVQPFRDAIRTQSPVTRVRRLEQGVEVTVGDGQPEPFDAVVLAVHSDQALRMLADPSSAERDILGALPYQRNEAVLHTDDRLLPTSRRARAAWNYVLPRDAQGTVSVTYDMNVLQGLDAPVTFCLTLNPSQDIDPDKVIERLTYQHPVFNAEGIAAQRRRDEIDGQRGTHFCGAYWGYGFHEDGVRSALHVARQFGIESLEAAALPACELALAPTVP
ncbi:MAG: putative NAD/FAD-binding protein [Pseudohongiellaceae bacterium]|jgi:predicted NAD/FAD-binding protein